jgi:N-acetylmuramoyl-L-alanine amidase
MRVKLKFIITGLLLALVMTTEAWAVNKLQDVRIWPSPDKYRVVFDLTKQPDFSYFSLNKPNRLVIDFKGTKLTAKLAKLKISGNLVKKIRTSKSPQKGMLRLVIELKKPLEPQIFSLPPTGPYGDRLVVDFVKKKPKSKSRPTSDVVKSTQSKKSRNRDIVIAIDAGHGGEDPGSIGASGRYEKHINLGIAKLLAKKINSTPGLKAVMTRRGDYYVGLNRRSEIARKAKTDLLVSIHADAFTSSRPRGASVLVLSMARANTEIGRLLENNERYSELLGGVGEIIESSENEKYFARMLIDMSMDNSMEESYEIGNGILSRLKKVTPIHRDELILASLAVLKSPDFPSLMVETGFVSNPTDERRLYNKKHRVELANAIFGSINDYFKKNPPSGSMYANRRSKSHKVSRGESLSVVAQRYRISVASLKKHNALRSNTLRIGQVLAIPQS